MSMGGGGGTSTNTVTKADPWIGLQPALTELYGSSLGNFRSGGPDYYPNSTLAPTNIETNQALTQGWWNSQSNLSDIQRVQGQLGATASGNNQFNPYEAGISNIGAGGALNDNFANQALRQTISGDYLTEQTNPYLRGVFENASSAVTDQFKNAIAPGLASQFSSAGRTGSGASLGAFDNASATLGRTLSQTANSIYGGAYEAERGRQQQAIGMLGSNYENAAGRQFSALQSGTQQNQFNRQMQQQAQLSLPQMQAAQQQNLSQLLGIGEYRQNADQQRINEDKARWDYNANKPTMNLQLLNQLLQGGMSLSGSNSQGTQSGSPRNPFQGAAGGAATGASIGSVVPGLGTGIGALIGGLGGLLFG